MPEDGNIVTVPETQGVRYKSSMRTTLNAMRQLRAELPVTVVIRFDGNKHAQSDVTIGLIFPEHRQHFQNCFDQIERVTASAIPPKQVVKVGTTFDSGKK
jgi:hypothetical protein